MLQPGFPAAGMIHPVIDFAVLHAGQEVMPKSIAQRRYAGQEA
jgi:hypothetical protein